MGMPGYTKLFSSILASTIWRAPDKTRIVWITLLAMADKNGVAECSVPGLADLARVSVDDCRAAIAELQLPDPDSRTKEYEGRRIEPTDGGFLILNHPKYREKLNEDQRREYMRLKQAAFRAKKRQKTLPNVTDVSDKLTELTHTEAKADTDTKALKAIDQENAETIYKLYPRKVKKPDAIRAIIKALKRESAEFLALQTKKYAASPYVAAKPDFIPYPATWFNAEGYNDEADWSMVVIPPGQKVQGGFNGQATKAQQRTAGNIGAIQAGLGIEPRSVRGSLPSGDKRSDGGDLCGTVEGEVTRKD